MYPRCLFTVAQIFDPLCSARKTPAAFCLSLPARNERGESRREGKLIRSASSPRPSPPFLRRGGRENAAARSKQILSFCRTQQVTNLRYGEARRSRNQRSAGLWPAGALPATQRFNKSSASVALNVLRLTAALRKIFGCCDDFGRYW